MKSTDETENDSKMAAVSKERKKVEQSAVEIAREFIEKHTKEVLETYLKNAKGHFEKRYTESGIEYEVWVVDAASTRHFVDKLIPAMKQEVEVNLHGSVEVFTNVDPDGISQK